MIVRKKFVLTHYNQTNSFLFHNPNYHKLGSRNILYTTQSSCFQMKRDLRYEGFVDTFVVDLQ